MYKHRVDEFPDRNLAPGRQLGWLADEVEDLFPELVSEDEQGMKGIYLYYY